MTEQPNEARAVNDFALNVRAGVIADRMAFYAKEFGVTVNDLPSGARVIDAGVAARGGLGAGQAIAHICMGGLGHVSFVPLSIGGDAYQGVQVWTDHPAIACMASQYAGWAIHVDKFFAMGSGPLRALARVEHELFEKLAYTESANRGALVLEGRTPPTNDVATWVSERAGLPPSALTFIIAPTASAAGSVQIATRILETGLHKMDALGFDVRLVTDAIGTAPLAPVAKDDLRAIGRTNDCILYGGQARYTVQADDATLETLAHQLPASASADYGTPFYEIFERYNRDFYKIDKSLFSPGEVWLTSATSGRTFHAGRLEPSVLRTSLFG
jgi:methenyltetrahydromethanopterin cyclohydrolase